MIACGAALSALFAPPNTWDSQTYHLSRVAHWAQNGSVHHYPTHIQRQIIFPPLAEFLILHEYVLAGGDSLANMIQWGSMLAGCIAASSVAQLFGCSPVYQLLAALLYASIPMGILQASSTQNDLVAALTLMLAVYHTLSRFRCSSTLSLALAATSLGLALLAKSTGYVFGLPIGAALAWSVAKEPKPLAREMRALMLVAALVLLPNGPHMFRNLRLYGHPLATSRAWPGVRLTNEILGPGAIASSLLRNASIHLQMPWDTINRRHKYLLIKLHRILGVDAADQRTTFGTDRFGVRRLSTHESYAGNVLHFGMFAACCALFFSPKVRKDSSEIGIYCLLLVLAAVLFCVVLKWQPWHSRLHLPLFGWAAAPMAAILNRWRRGDARFAVVVGSVLALQAAPFVVANELRPLVGSRNVFTTERFVQYFAERPELESDYRAAVEWVRGMGATRVGIVLGEDDWEYPLWALLGRSVAECEIVHTAVRNPSVRAAAGQIPPKVRVEIDNKRRAIRFRQSA